MVGLASRALIYGTLLACFIFTAAVWGLNACTLQFTSMEEVREYLGQQRERELKRLAEDGGGDVHRVVLDLTDPTALVEQVGELWRLVERLVAEAAAEEDGEGV